MQHRTAFLLVVLAVLAVLAVPGRTQTTEDSPDELRWTTVRKYVGGTRTVTSRRYIPGTSVRRAHVGRTFVPSNTNTRRLTYKRVFKQGRLVTRRQAYRAYVRSAALPTRRIYWFRDFKGGDFLTFTYSEGINARLRYYGSPFFLYSTQAPGTRPIYRCWSGVDHYYSFDPRCEGPHYRPEGLLGYIPISRQSCATTPLVRSYSPTIGHYARFNVAGPTARVEGTLGYAPTCQPSRGTWVTRYRTTTVRSPGHWVNEPTYTTVRGSGRWQYGRVTRTRATRPIYWFRDFMGGDFLTFTYSEGINAKLLYKGSPFMVFTQPAAGLRAIYRCWSGRDHYYSFDPKCEGPHYRPEGLLGYISVTPGTCTAKLVRSYSPSVGHFARFNVAGPTARVEGTLGYPITCAAGAKYTTTGRYWQSGRWVSRTSYTVHTTAGRWVTVRRQVPSGRWVTQRVWRPDPKPTPTPTPTPTRVQRYYRWIGKCLYLTTTRGRYTSNRKIRCRSSQVVTGQWVTLYEGTQQIRKYLSAAEVREFAAACPTFASRLRSGKL